MRLTRQAIEGLRLPPGRGDYRVPDDDVRGLYVRLRADTARRVWVVRFPNDRWQTIGDVTQIEPADARKIARRRFAEAELGGDPIAEKAEARARAKLTLGKVADDYLDRRGPARRSSTNKADTRYLTRHWRPLRELPVHAVTRADVAKRLGEIAKEHGAVAASAARRSLSALYAWAAKEGLVENNPAANTNDPAAGIRSRERVLDASEIRSVWRACLDDDFGRIIKLLLLTGCRREEIGGLRWSELDLERGVLTIPGSRTKNHREHSLTLPPLALEILEGAPRREGRDLIFGTRGAAFTAWSYSKIALDARITTAEGRPLAPWRLHDLRRSAVTHMAEIGIAPHVCEAIVNHQSGHKAGTAGIYNRASYQREIGAALAVWANHVQAIVDDGERTVVTLRTG
jgi:integrase